MAVQVQQYVCELRRWVTQCDWPCGHSGHTLARGEGLALFRFGWLAGLIVRCFFSALHMACQGYECLVRCVDCTLCPRHTTQTQALLGRTFLTAHLISQASQHTRNIFLALRQPISDRTTQGVSRKSVPFRTYTGERHRPRSDAVHQRA